MTFLLGKRGFLAAATILAFLGLAFDAGGAAAQSGAQSSTRPKPNILFIILDDVGIDQMRVFGFGGPGPLAARMPNIGRIARRGVRFTNVWAMPECSPSRAAFFTGRYPLRTGVTSAIVGNHLPQEYLSQFEATLPRVLERGGYVSAMVGKYHLGNDKDPAGDCAPATRGWHRFMGNMTPGPPSIDQTAGGADPSGGQVCGYVQTSSPGACYLQREGGTVCRRLGPHNAAEGSTAARTCLQRGGLFRPGAACGEEVPDAEDFERTNAYYVWPRVATLGQRSPLWVDREGDSCAPTTDREYMTERQSDDAARWWNNQSGPRMLTVSYNAMHTPFQKAPTSLVPDPRDWNSTCDPLLTQRRLINNMLEGTDVAIGRMLADMGLARLDPEGRRMVSLDLRDTVIVIVGDNGSYGSTVRVADGFDAGRSKASVYQTGVWVPLIVAGGPVTRPGREVDAQVNVVDLFQLFGDLAGVNVNEVVPPSRTLDSQSLMGYLLRPNTRPVRRNNFTQVAAGTFTPDPAERSWPCLQANLCNDTLLFNQNLCEDNAGVWYGPGAQVQLSSCCAVAAANDGVTINPVAQWAVRNGRFKLVERLETDCAASLPPGAAERAFPWAEYDTRTRREFYNVEQTDENPLGLDDADGDLLANCPDGADPESCLGWPARRGYANLSRLLDEMRESADAQDTCRSLGDGNLDLRVDRADIEAWRRFSGGGPSQYDINLDGRTNRADLAIIRANLGTDCMDPCARADLDRNGRVDAADMALLRAQYGRCDPVLCGGDLDGDGRVDLNDVRLMQQAQRSCRAARG